MPENFLKKFVSLLEGTEVPPRFAIWCGISAITAMLERRVWVNMGHYTIYPNMFIVLIAESGRARKSTAVKTAGKLLSKVDPGPRQIAQKITPEAFISASRTVRNEGGKNLMAESCGGIVIADELMTFLNKRSYEQGIVSLLIQYYDCLDRFTYETKGRGTEEVNLAHLSLLGASTAGAVREAIPAASIGEGLTSRICFIFVDETPPPVAWTEFSAIKAKTEEELVHYLQVVSNLKGPITLDTNAKEFFIYEYERFYAESSFYENPHLGAYATRRHTHLIKIAIAIMASENPTNVLNASHIQGAKYLLDEAETQMPKALEEITTSEVGGALDRVYKVIKSRGTISKSELLRQFSHRMDAKQLSEIMETLIISGRVKGDTMAGSLIYKIPKENK